MIQASCKNSRPGKIRAIRRLPQFLMGIMDIIFPRNCILCRRHHPSTARNPLCPDCRRKLPWNKTPLHCKTSRPVHFDQAISLFYYTGHARALLKQFKFHDKTSLRRSYAFLLRLFFRKHPLHLPGNTLIIPIPLHAARLKERGYNQSALIADAIASIINRPSYGNILQRQHPTTPQSQLHAKDRWTNMRGAFKIQPLTDIVGKNVLLVDDILTTGATASEAAKTLKEAGASRVILITLANATCASCTVTS